MQFTLKDAVLITVSLLINTVFVVLYLHFFHKAGATPVAIVEINGLIESAQIEFAKKVTQPGLSETERKQLQDAILTRSKKIDEALDQLSKECQCILINRNQIYPSKYVVDYSEKLKSMVN